MEPRPPRPPLPPFTAETAAQKVRLAEDAWNTRDPDRVVKVYTEDTRWRNRAEFPVGRDQVHVFLVRKWAKELEYRLIKELWAFEGTRIAVRFVYEWPPGVCCSSQSWKAFMAALLRRVFRRVSQ